MTNPDGGDDDVVWQPKAMKELSPADLDFMKKQFAIMDWACSLSMPSLFLRARGYGR